MPFTGIASPEQLAVLRRALDEHCLEIGTEDDLVRELIAARIIVLFSSGVSTLEGLKHALGQDRRM